MAQDNFDNRERVLQSRELAQNPWDRIDRKKEERYRSERIQWAVHVFARQRLRRTGTEPAASGEVPDVEDVLRGLGASVDLPRSLGRLTKFLMSPERKQRLRGLQVLHRRFWHAKLQDLKTLLERGGVDLDEAEIKAVIDACPVCRAWKKPSIPPKIKMNLAEKFNDEIDFDFFFYKGQPVGLFVDHATRVCLGVVTVSREVQDCKDAFTEIYGNCS